MDDLAHVQHDPALTNLTVLVDIDEPYVVTAFRRFADERGYRSFHFRINEDHNPNEVRISARRLRIADMKNQSKDLILKTDGEYVIGFEDDTVFTRLDSFDRLLNPLLEDDKVGFVEGVQCGRWGVNMIGAWSCDDFNFPQKVWTLLPGEGYQEIDGGGFYGYATRRDLYLNCEYYSSSAQPWGPDVNFGLSLRNKGYKCLVDWETVYGHSVHGQILWPTTRPLTSIIYTKNPQTGKWDRQDMDKAS